MSLYLVNSAMMPDEGDYRCMGIGIHEVKKLVTEEGVAKSYIGYPQAKEVLEELLEIPVELCRDRVTLEDGDIMVAMRLRYRVNPGEKDKGIHGQRLKDYDFFRIDFFRIGDEYEGK